jgi:glyoxylase-like metal-dependent hydrolase (beta-lactamase superfamily II)/rhodanese-related sulfurtransferase
MHVETIETKELGDRSYIVDDGTFAVVVDPQRDIDRVEEALGRLVVTCVVVLETHIHNDYVTGGYVLAHRTGARYVVAAGADVTFERTAVSDGDQLEAGELRITVVGTPGHTEDHLAYVVRHGDDAPAVFTGGSLLYGSVGRTDLIDPALTEHLTREQFRSAHRLGELLPDDAPIFPTHGFGSFCSSGAPTGDDQSTIGVEKGRNDAFVEPDEDRFVATLVAGLSAYPSYYAHMAPINRSGPGPVDLSPPTVVDPSELARRLHVGEWVVDLRSRTAFAKEHLGGTISIALGEQFSTYLGWLTPWGAPLTLIATTSEDVTAAQLQLARIGIDRPGGSAVGTPRQLADGSPLRSYPIATFARLKASKGARVLDVRRDDARAKGAIPGSDHIPLNALIDRIDDVPNEPLWVHCASGFRASIAASLLARAGHDVILVDDEFANAEALGLVE